MDLRSLIPALLFAACAAPNPRVVSAGELAEVRATGLTAPAPGVDEADEVFASANSDPSVVTGEFTLTAAMDLARANAIGVLRAADAHLAATAELRFARTDTFYPHIFAGAQTGRLSGVAQITSSGNFDPVDNESANLGLGLRFGVDLATATHGLDAARENIRATNLDWIAAGLAAETAAALLYHDLLEAQARVDIAEAAVDSAVAYHAFAETRFQAGAGLEADVLRAYAHLAEMRQQRVEALAARGISSTHLAELLGLDPLRPLEPVDALAAHDLIGDVAEVDIHTHPVIEAAHARLAAAEARDLEQRSSWYLPEFLLEVGFNDFGREFGDLDRQETATAALSWDLSPSVFARADRSHADLMRARHDTEAAQRRIESSLVRAQISVLAADDLIETTQARVDSARAAVGLERTRHEEGDALLIELLDVEVSLRRAETAHVAAICSHNRAQHLLREAIGG